MPITANVTNEQITASVGETQIDVSVSGGVGPSGAAGSNGQAATVAVGTVTTGAAGSQASVTNVGTSSAAILDFTIPAGATGATGPQGATGPAGTTTWAGITDKPAFAAVATSGSASDLSTGTLNASRLPASVVRTGAATDGVVFVDAVECNPTPIPDIPADVAVFRGYDGVDGTSAIYADGRVACTAITLAGTDLATTLSGKAAASHQHSAGDITSGVVATARLASSGTANSTTFLRGDQTWAAPTASVSYATTAQSQDLTATTVAMHPANVRTAISNWLRIQYQFSFTASGGSVSNQYPAFISLVGSANANGAAVGYQNAGTSGLWASSRGAFNWSNPVSFYVRFARSQASSTGIYRVLLGQTPSGGFAWETLGGRGIGFEVRQTRIWMIVHNGTALSVTDTGIDAASTDFSGNTSDLWIRSDGAGNVTLTHSLSGAAASTYTATGGPTGNASAMVAYQGVNNGANASQTWFIGTHQLISVQS